MKLKALIFDIDGTLADTEEAHRQSFNDAFAQVGLNWNWSRPEYGHLLGVTGGKERLAAFIASLPLSPADRNDLTARIGHIHRTKTEFYTRRILAGAVPLRDGVERLLDEAAQHRVRLAIASTTTLVNIEALLHSTLGADAMQRFAVIGAGDQVAHKKPAGDIYEYVLRELGLPAEACVAIEDSQNGLRAAKAAQLYTIVTPSYWTMGEDFSAADLLLPSLIGGPGIRELDEHLRVTRSEVAHQP